MVPSSRGGTDLYAARPGPELPGRTLDVARVEGEDDGVGAVGFAHMPGISAVVHDGEVPDGSIAHHVNHTNNGVNLLATFDLDLHRSTKMQGGFTREKARADNCRIRIAGLEVVDGFDASAGIRAARVLGDGTVPGLPVTSSGIRVAWSTATASRLVYPVVSPASGGRALVAWLDNTEVGSERKDVVGAWLAP